MLNKQKRNHKGGEVYLDIAVKMIISLVISALAYLAMVNLCGPQMTQMVNQRQDQVIEYTQRDDALTVNENDVVNVDIA